VWDQLTSFLRTAGVTAIVIALIIAIAAWIAGPSRGATKVRGTWTRALGERGSSDGITESNPGATTSFVARHKGALRVVGLAIAIAILILWNHPTAGTVLVVGLLLLLYLAVIELLGRASDAGDTTLDRSAV
jgi:hypothetical protein